MDDVIDLDDREPLSPDEHPALKICVAGVMSAAGNTAIDMRERQWSTLADTEPETLHAYAAREYLGPRPCKVALIVATLVDGRYRVSPCMADLAAH